MSDRELLELAAKAAGVAGEYCEFHKHPEGTLASGIGNPRVFRWGDYLWNPLTDDGDALRLAVRLEMEIRCMGARCYAQVPNVTELSDQFNTKDPYAATRRAIVRAAAEIGKNLTGEN